VPSRLIEFAADDVRVRRADAQAAVVHRTARTIAGKMYTLFPWPGSKRRPLISTGGKGLPLANTAWPFDQ
jgi:hypothetical protein